MAYRAFVVGADYHSKFAVADARRIADALQTLGYELPEPLIPPPEEDNTAIAARFKKFATECEPEDTLLFYFAGHGLVYHGLLCLLLETYDPARNPLQTCLSANDLSIAFQASEAGNKLMILDCCHAGAAFGLADFDFSDNYLVLTASEAYEKALEFKDRQAGFLSHHLHNALTEDLAKVTQDSRVGLNALQTYLRQQVDKHNRTSPDKVPEITVVSKQRRDMVLVELADPHLNLSGLVCVNPAFLAAERAKTGSRYTPENFYGALPPVQWWGVANGLVAEQSIYLSVEQHVRQAINAYPPLIAVLHGSGGMGKSVLLRRLGASLAGEFDVWWLDDPQALLDEQEEAQTKLLESGRPHLILIDDWSAIDADTRNTLRAWFEQLVKSGDGQYLKFVLTSRYWKAEELPLKLVYANSLFDFDRRANLAHDNPLLLDKAVAQLDGPGWEETARELRTPQMAQTKPFHLLFVLMRLGEDTRLRAKIIAERDKTRSFEHIFQDIIQDDLENLWRDLYKKGLAAAVSMAAYLHMQYRLYLGKTALLKLADHYNSLYPLPSASQPADWGTLKYYLYTYRNPMNKRQDAEDFVAFIEDEFAETLIAADDRGHHHVENRWVPDLEFLVCEADVYTSSYLFYNVCQHTPTLWNATKKQALVCHLLDRQNSHHAYAWILLHDDIFDDETKRWELILRYLDIAPKNFRFATRFLNWTNRHAPDKTKLFACQLLQQPEQTPQVICTALGLLDRAEAQPFARKLLEQLGQDHQVICTALGLLDRAEAQPFARKLLEQPGQDHQVICTALGLLDRAEAQPFARKLLEQPGQDHQVICTALGLLDRAEAQPFARKLLEQLGQDHQVICTALGLLDRAEAQPFARKLLEQPGQATEVICTALGLLDRAEAQPFARKLLEQPGQDHQVICTALGLLDKEAEDFALRVLNNWMSEPFSVVLRCLNIIPTSKQAEQVVSFLLKNKGDKYKYFTVLRYPFNTIKSWRRETSQIIKNWIKHNRLTVASVMNHYLNDEEFLRNTCQDILSAWKNEIEYQKRKGYQQVCTAHILKALAHPQLRTLAKKEATTMRMYEMVHPGFLGDPLLHATESIVRKGRYPDWVPTSESEVIEDVNGETMQDLESG